MRQRKTGTISLPRKEREEATTGGRDAPSTAGTVIRIREEIGTDGEIVLKGVATATGAMIALEDMTMIIPALATATAGEIMTVHAIVMIGATGMTAVLVTAMISAGKEGLTEIRKATDSARDGHRDAAMMTEEVDTHVPAATATGITIQDVCTGAKEISTVALLVIRRLAMTAVRSVIQKEGEALLSRMVMIHSW